MANFITAQQVRNVTQVSGEADGSLIEPFIITGQDKYLRQFLGDEFYTDLKAAIPSPTAAEATLIDDYITPYLCWVTLSEALPRIRTRVHNGGVFQRTSQDTAPVDQKAFDREIGWAKETFASYQSIMERFLDDNATDYPLWKKCKSNPTRSVVIIA